MVYERYKIQLNQFASNDGTCETALYIFAPRHFRINFSNFKMNKSNTLLITEFKKNVSPYKRTWQKIDFSNSSFAVNNKTVLIPKQIGEFFIISVDNESYKPSAKLLNTNCQLFYLLVLPKASDDEKNIVDTILPENFNSPIYIYLNGKFLGTYEELNVFFEERRNLRRSSLSSEIDVSTLEPGKIIEINHKFFSLGVAKDGREYLKQLSCNIKSSGKLSGDVNDIQAAGLSSMAGSPCLTSFSSASTKQLATHASLPPGYPNSRFEYPNIGFEHAKCEQSDQDIESSQSVKFYQAHPVKDAIASNREHKYMNILRAVFSSNSYRKNIGFWLILGQHDCQFCKKTKDLLSNNNQSFTFVDKAISTSQQIEWFKNRIPPNWNTIPVVLLDRIFIGGYSELSKYLTLFKK